jgi:antitoxin HicB
MESQEVTYSVIIDEQGGGYLVHFPDLPGCNTWGEIYQEAVRNAGEALRVYLESLEALRRALPRDHHIDEPVSLGMTVRVPIIT